jgi:hypothetical protein
MLVEERAAANSYFEFYWKDTPGIGQLILLAVNEFELPPTRILVKKWVWKLLDEKFGTIVDHKIIDPSTNQAVSWREREFDDGMEWVIGVVDALNSNREGRTLSFSVPLFQRWLRDRIRHHDLLEDAYETILKEMERDNLV